MLSLCAAKICRLVLAEAVREEVEENLLLHAAGLAEARELLDDYTGLIKLARPEIVPYPDEADVPVLLSAMKAKPDWLLTHNINHFTPQVAKRTPIADWRPGSILSTPLSRYLLGAASNFANWNGDN